MRLGPSQRQSVGLQTRPSDGINTKVKSQPDYSIGVGRHTLAICPRSDLFMAGHNEVRWIVRLTPPSGQTVRDLLTIPLPLDVWEREADALVAAITEQTLGELERRHLAGVERLCTTAEFEKRAVDLARPDDPAGKR
jgi:hypothetical protein